MRADQIPRRVIRCPLCSKGRLADVADYPDPLKMTLYGPQQADRAQMFLKCTKCGQQIGIFFGRTR